VSGLNQYLTCNKCGHTSVVMAVNMKVELPAGFFRKLPTDFSQHIEQCWVGWDSITMRCTQCGKFFPLDPKHENQTSVEDLVFENMSGRIENEV
jgi:hypothetical protein